MRPLMFAPVLALAACNPYKDGDDGTQDTAGNSTSVDADGDGFATEEDCDDADASVNPGAIEVCNGLDDNCNGVADEGVTEVFYGDADGDGYGDAGTQTDACTLPAGFSAESTDCDDLDAATHPGAAERCDLTDNDCDGLVDEDLAEVWYADTDGDGFGDPEAAVEDCDPPAGHSAVGTDCDDGNASISPVATEVCDGADNDCDGTIDEDDAVGAATWYADTDVDGYGDAGSTARACDQPSGFVADDTDCDDTEALVSPAGTELCNGVDDDCDGATDEDDAADASIWWADTDSDGYGGATLSTAACSQPSGYSAVSTDCDDAEPLANPGETEVCDEIDNNCDGDIDEGVTSTWYLDYDGDGYGDDDRTVEGCTAPTTEYVATGGDCDDADTAYNPAATAGCDGEDYDCDGSVDNDGDGDGYADDTCGGDDCDDSDSSIYPESTGDCALGISCQDIYDGGTTTDGTYTIDWDGYGTGDDPIRVICDMTTDGGGWTQIALQADGGNWTTTTVNDSTTFGTVGNGSDHKSEAWNNVDFEDVMFSDGSMYAAYDGVHDGSSDWGTFSLSVPAPNCGTTDGYEYTMTAGTLSASDLCNTNLYIHPIDLDGGANTSCTAAYVWGNDATGPAWSASNNNGCPLDDPAGTSFVSNAWATIWSTTDPLEMYVR